MTVTARRSRDVGAVRNIGRIPRRLGSGLLAGLLVVSACGGSDSESSRDTEDEANLPIETDTDPTADAPPTPPDGSTIPTGDGVVPPSNLTPAPDADLPTGLPSDEPVPVTTAPGPLVAPDVRLLDVADFAAPVEATARPGDERLFVVEQGGTIIATDAESATTVLDLLTVEGVTLATDNEQGLLGLAFHPENDLAYIDYTNGQGDTVIAEFAVDPVEATFDAATYREVMIVEQPFANHNGGELEFGPDGLLYIGLGDGGAADDPNRNSLDLSDPLGKILRVDPLESADGAFTVPSDNPFVGVEGADPRIWSIGLRNPWRFSFDALTGDLWVADVGQNRLEEVNLALAQNGVDAGKGVSFGWSAFEADERFNDDQSADGHTLPVVSYPHEDGNCSVSGGVVARDSTFDGLDGWYLYGDYCSGRLWGLDTTSVTITPDGPVGEPVVVELATVPGLASVAAGPNGDIYAISNAGPIYRLIPN